MDIIAPLQAGANIPPGGADLAGALPLEILSDQLSDLADMILDETLRLAWAGLRVKHRDTPRFAVIAYGKLGGKELGYASDLDIIFLTTMMPGCRRDLCQAGTTHQQLISSMTPAGILYETDLRLRRMAPAACWSAQSRRSRTTRRNRPGCGASGADPPASAPATPMSAQAFERIRIEVLRQERDAATLREEVQKMRRRC